MERDNLLVDLQRYKDGLIKGLRKRKA